MKPEGDITSAPGGRKEVTSGRVAVGRNYSKGGKMGGGARPRKNKSQENFQPCWVSLVTLACWQGTLNLWDSGILGCIKTAPKVSLEGTLRSAAVPEGRLWSLENHGKEEYMNCELRQVPSKTGKGYPQEAFPTTHVG